MDIYMDILGLKKRAEAGSLAAQTTLGACFVEGTGVGVDYEQAFKLLSGPAQRGVPAAVYYVARLHAGGLGVPQNRDAAWKLYQRAAEAGHFFAQIELARMYSKGEGVPVDRDAARKWYSTAVAQDADLDDCDEELREAKAYLAPTA